METPQSGTSQTPSSSGIGGATVVPLTPTSHTSTTELPSLQTLLGEILVENIGKEQAFVDAALDSFKEEDVSNVSLLITLYENSKPTAGQEPFPKAFTDRITVNGRCLSHLFWVLLGQRLDMLCPPSPTPETNKRPRSLVQSDLFCENWICFVKCWEH